MLIEPLSGHGLVALGAAAPLLPYSPLTASTKRASGWERRSKPRC